MDVHSTEIRSYNMSRIRSKATKIEILLGRALWKKGVRYRKNSKLIFGKPDFSFKAVKLAVFCDSEFWHGKEITKLEQRIGTNKEFWISKIRKNIERDQRVNQFLAGEGWIVLRYWETDIKKNPESIADGIIEIISSLRQAP